MMKWTKTLAGIKDHSHTPAETMNASSGKEKDLNGVWSGPSVPIEFPRRFISVNPRNCTNEFPRKYISVDPRRVQIWHSNEFS